jgi:hypothetical protein
MICFFYCLLVWLYLYCCSLVGCLGLNLVLGTELQLGLEKYSHPHSYIPSAWKPYPMSIFTSRKCTLHTLCSIGDPSPVPSNDLYNQYPGITSKVASLISGNDVPYTCGIFFRNPNSTNNSCWCSANFRPSFTFNLSFKKILLFIIYLAFQISITCKCTLGGHRWKCHHEWNSFRNVLLLLRKL